jgi:aspartate carbamoyltransferase regulatory subunit
MMLNGSGGARGHSSLMQIKNVLKPSLIHNALICENERNITNKSTLISTKCTRSESAPECQWEICFHLLR